MSRGNNAPWAPLTCSWWIRALYKSIYYYYIIKHQSLFYYLQTFSGMGMVVNVLIRHMKVLTECCVNENCSLYFQPPILFISCIDSRILPTHFCQTSPGDMFILRNAGNVLPRANYTAGEPTQLSCEVVALEITCNRSKVEHVVICGHSDCQVLCKTFYIVSYCYIYKLLS